MPHDLTALVRSFRGRRVLLVGDLILDRYIYGDAERISPEAPVPVLRAIKTEEAVGGSANVAACLHALGCEVACCGIIGDDSSGATLAALLRELGTDTSGVVKVSNRPTTAKTRLVGLAQHRHRQQLLRVDEEETSPLPAEIVEKLIDATCRQIESADVVCVEDYDKGCIHEELMKAITTKAQQCQRQVLVDPARLRSYERYHGVNVITPNREELSIAVGKSILTPEAAGVAAQELIASHRISAAVVTLDREGSIVAQADRWHHLPTVPRSVYDNTGAGDAVMATLSAATAAGADLSAAAQLANVTGGLEVERFGCVPVSADEILADLRIQHRSENGKLRGVDELLAELRLHRDRGETIAFTNGCFDILHAGHVAYLQRCRQEASVLVVGLNSDASVKAQKKGTNRPINTFENRAAVLGALESIDYVVGFSETDPEKLIQQIQPDVLVKGEDWAAKGVVGRDFVEAHGGRVVLVPLVEGISTTDLISRMKRGD